MEEKEEDSSTWKCGIAIVIVGVVSILSVASFSAAYFGLSNIKYSIIIGGMLFLKLVKLSIAGKGGCWSHPSLSAGQLTYSDSAMVDGSKVTFSCNSSLYVSGPKEKKCRASSWTPDETVTCREVA